MRLDWTVYGIIAVLIGVFLLLFVPDTSETATLVDLRSARATVEEATFSDRFVYGTQWPDFVGNGLLMLGIITIAIGLGAPAKPPR